MNRYNIYRHLSHYGINYLTTCPTYYKCISYPNPIPLIRYSFSFIWLSLGGRHGFLSLYSISWKQLHIFDGFDQFIS